ncbi:hypothetical protein SAY87_003686 [Trapa incisa]|uniref:Uncharacterized protein n=1 Tax=Trapa incisa TaxID=236973 RepID=A0AAN7QLE4_9MYRT|nr:hypothetical protein SAY87_003686 [Trapa incisa]
MAVCSICSCIDALTAPVPVASLVKLSSPYCRIAKCRVKKRRIASCLYLLQNPLCLLDADEKSSSISSTSRDGEHIEPLALEGQNENIILDMGGDDTIQLNVSKNASMISDGSPSFTSLIVASPPNISFQDGLLLNEMGTGVSSNSSMNGKSASKKESLVTTSPTKKKMRCDLPPKLVTTIEEMERIFARSLASPRSIRPRWSSVRDKELLAARKEIQNAPIALGDQELYSPLYRNISMFKRSYELMERMLRVYVYKKGKKPIFHQPILKGLYGSRDGL